MGSITMDHFTTLPEELLDSIFNKLDNGISSPFLLRARRRDYFHLALVCQKVNRIVTPYLYSHLNSERRCDLLFRTLRRKPEIRGWVRTIHWIYQAHPDNTVLGKCFLGGPLDQDAMKRIMYCLGVWDGDLEGQTTRAANLLYPKDNIAALLCFTPNLRNLHIKEHANLVREQTVAYTEAGIPAWIRILDAGPRHGYFRRLTSLSLDMGHLRLNDLAPIFRLPSLKGVKLLHVFEPSATLGDNWTHCAPRSLPIRSLSLTRVAMHTTALCQLLHCMRGLTKLEVHFFIHTQHRRFVALRRKHLFLQHYATLAAAISAHSNTLAVLMLADMRHAKYPAVDAATSSLLPSLGRCTNVRFYATSMNVLFGTQFNCPDTDMAISRIPPHVRCLYILVDLRFVWWATVLGRFAQRCKRRLPLLRGVMLIVLPMMKDKVSLFNRGRLSLLFADQGITVHFHGLPS